MLYIGVLQFTLELPYAESLKEKRGVLKALRDRLRRSFNVSISEFEDLDDPTTAPSVAIVGSSRSSNSLIETLNDLRKRSRSALRTPRFSLSDSA